METVPSQTHPTTLLRRLIPATPIPLRKGGEGVRLPQPPQIGENKIGFRFDLFNTIGEVGLIAPSLNPFILVVIDLF